MKLVPVTLEGRSAWLLSVAALVAGLVGLGLAFRHGGEGIQTLLSAKLWFPFALLSARWADSFWDFPVAVLFLQFPVYAVVLTVGGLRGGLRTTAAVIGSLHITAVVLCVLTT